MPFNRPPLPERRKKIGRTGFSKNIISKEEPNSPQQNTHEQSRSPDTSENDPRFEPTSHTKAINQLNLSSTVDLHTTTPSNQVCTKLMNDPRHKEPVYPKANQSVNIIQRVPTKIRTGMLPPASTTPHHTHTHTHTHTHKE